jgi:peptide deformylase
MSILPIVAYGDPVLRRKAEPISRDYPNLGELIENMFETMYKAGGVGLAAPQIGKSIRLFIVDAAPFAEDEPELENFQRIFINPQILDEAGKPFTFNEGCLSIPGIREDVSRMPNIILQYQDENFNEYKEGFTGLAARIIQHEYDHIEGVLFTDHLGPLKKKFLQKRLDKIRRGEVSTDYKMKFPGIKK